MLQVSPLLDALSKNTSLYYLNLGKSGITWMGPSSEVMGRGTVRGEVMGRETVRV